MNALTPTHFGILLLLLVAVWAVVGAVGNVLRLITLAYFLRRREERDKRNSGGGRE